MQLYLFLELYRCGHQKRSLHIQKNIIKSNFSFDKKQCILWILIAGINGGKQTYFCVFASAGGVSEQH